MGALRSLVSFVLVGSVAGCGSDVVGSASSPGAARPPAGEVRRPFGAVPQPPNEPNVRRVFVSSKAYAGDFGGITGADATCEDLASDAGLGGTWLAWLSDNDASPAARFVHANVPYALVGGAQIAD